MGWDYVDRLGRYHFKPIEEARENWRIATPNERWLLIRGIGAMTELSPGDHLTDAAK